MEDCKHEHWHEYCCVCWFKISMGIKVNGAPDMLYKSDKKELLNMAAGIADAHCRVMKQKRE